MEYVLTVNMKLATNIIFIFYWFNSCVAQLEKDGEYCGTTNIEGSKDLIEKIKDLDRHDMPWMVALGYNTTGMDNVQFKCSGTLISPEYVLTSASCINRKLMDVIDLPTYRTISGITEKLINIVRDKLPLENNHRISARTNIAALTDASQINGQIVSTHRHEAFMPFKHKNDIGLVKIKWNKNISADNVICLPTKDILQKYNNTVHPFVAGWSLDRPGKMEHILQLSQQVIIPENTCQQVQKTTLAARLVTRGNICTNGYRNVPGPCTGDVGGPLMLPITIDDLEFTQMVQMGVISWWNDCTIDGIGTVYTNVVDYLDWIKDKME